jgi:uncharacterized protein YkwD
MRRGLGIVGVFIAAGSTGCLFDAEAAEGLACVADVDCGPDLTCNFGYCNALHSEGFCPQVGGPEHQADPQCAVFYGINDTRLAADLDPYDWDPDLMLAARNHLEDVDGSLYPDETLYDGSRVGEAVSSAGYNAVDFAWNAAEGSFTAAKVVEVWRDVAPQNLLSEDFEDVGVGLYRQRWIMIAAEPY